MPTDAKALSKSSRALQDILAIEAQARTTADVRIAELEGALHAVMHADSAAMAKETARAALKRHILESKEAKSEAG